jgi:hypothetical protein
MVRYVEVRSEADSRTRTFAVLVVELASIELGTPLQVQVQEQGGYL